MPQDGKLALLTGKGAVNRIIKNRPKSAQRRLIVERMLPLQNNMCWWHGAPIGGKGRCATKTIEHLLPLFMGGTNRPSNIVIACERCNNARGLDQDWCMHSNLIGTVRERLLGPDKELELFALLNFPWVPIPRHLAERALSNGDRTLTSLAP